MKRLQLRHHDETLPSRESALDFFSDILNPENVKNGKFGTSLYAEPMVVKYTDSYGKTQILFAIGTDTPNAPYHIIDSAELSERIDNEIARAIAAEAILQNNIDAEVARAKDAESVLDKKINDEVLRATAEETRLQGAIDAEVARAMEAESVLDKKIDDNLTSIVSIEPSSTNVLEEYALKNNKNELLGEHIKIYKDSSLVGAVNGFKGAKMVEKMADGSFVLTYDEALRDESVEYLYLVYRNEEGNLKLVGIDFENFLMEAEFGDGMKVVDHVASIKIKDGEKYLETSKDGLYTINIDEAINIETIRAKEAESVLDKKIEDEIVRATAEEIRLQGVIDAEIARAKDAESVLDKKVSDEITRATGEETKINAEVKANKINSKDVVLNVTENGTNLTIQTDEVTITKKANASTIYDTNIAVLGSLLSVKKVTPTNTSIKSRYELQGADGKQIGDAIELPVESALIDIKQGKEGDMIDPVTGNYISDGTGDVTMNFVYRLEDGTYKLMQIVVSDYFTDSHFGKGLNNQDGVISLLEGDGNEFLVIGEDTIAVVGVNTAINEAKQSAIETVEATAKEYTDTKVSDLSLYVDTFVSTSINNVVNTFNNALKVESDRAIAAEEIISESINNEISNRTTAINELSLKIDNEINNRIENDNYISNRIDEEINHRLEGNENLRNLFNEELIKTNNFIISEINKEKSERITADTTEKAERITANENLRQEIVNSKIEAINEATAEASKEAKIVATEEIAKVVAGADSSYDTLKEIADWIVNDTTGSAQMANDIQQLKNKVDVLNGDKNTSGSLKKEIITGINDAMIINGPTITVTTPNDAANMGSLLRKIIISEDNDVQYYVSNRANEMLYVSTNGEVINLNTYINSLEEKIKQLEEKIENIDINSGNVSVSAEEVKEIIKNYLAGVENEIKIDTNEDESKLLIGFADDAIFG